MAGTGKAHLRESSDVLLRVEDLVVEFPMQRGRKVHAVSGISLDAVKGETLGLVGESGCGKSTTGRAIMQLPPPTGGKVAFDTVDLTKLRGKELRGARRQLQLIFQDPISSLNPRRRVKDLVADGLVIWGEDKDVALKKADEVLEAVGLNPTVVGDRRPFEFSGGQCQRICIARALALEPQLLICDEPVSALDASVQAQILNLLQDMKARYGLTLLFIAHDLNVVKNISDRVVVMYMGKICEVAESDELYAQPLHPYTNVLLASIPHPDPDNQPTGESISGELPSPITPPSGCRFRTRCPRATQECTDQEPQVREVEPGHFVACHHPGVTPSSNGDGHLARANLWAELTTEGA